MTEETNPVEQQIDSAAERLAQLRRLALKIENGLPVYDLNGERVGDVKEYSAVAGYLQVSAGAPGQRDLYLPYRLIGDIQAQEIHLVAPKDTLMGEYKRPPAIVTIVSNGGRQGAATERLSGAREVQLIANGYDGAMTEISAVELSSIAERLSVGLTVYDVDGVRLGEISEFDANRGLVVVESGLFAPTDHVAPFSAIGSVNRDTQSVHLTIQRAALHRLRNMWESEP